MEATNARVAAALVRAQRAFGPALKTATNPHFRSKYADLSACIEAVLEGLNSAGIALVQKTHPSDGGVAVETIFVHESGEILSAGILTVPATKADAQGYGSALTYARRYGLMAACGIAPEDDDGNAASQQTQSKPAPPARGVMPADRLQDWIQSISQADAETLEAIKSEALAAAAQCKDEAAYRAIRAAAGKRVKELKDAA